MPAKRRPEFYYDEKRKEYRKRKKDENGVQHDIYAPKVAELREKVKAFDAECARRKELMSSPPCFLYAKNWFELWSPGKGVKNIESVKVAINNHILPVIGNMRMCEIREEDLQRVLNASAELSKETNIKTLRTLKKIFRSALKDGTIAVDPSADLKPLGKPAKAKTALTEAQQERLLSAVGNCTIYPFVALVLYTGLRREEALGLEWDCVDLEADTPYLSVRRAWRWEENKAKISDQLKSKAARRDIPLPPQLVSILKAEKKQSTGNYVFGGEKPLTLEQFRRRWEAIEHRTAGERPKYTRDHKPVLDEQGNPVVVVYALGDKVPKHNVTISIDFPVTPHILRHTYITRLILSGANIKVVQYLAGHASVEITLDIYTQLMEHSPVTTAPEVFAAFGVHPPKAEESRENVGSGDAPEAAPEP